MATVIPAPQGATGWGTDFFRSVMTMKEQKRIQAKEAEELKLKKSAFGLKQKEFGLTQREKLANIQLVDVKRRIASLYSLPLEQERLKALERKSALQEKMMKSEDEKEREIAADSILGGSYSNYWRKLAGESRAQSYSLGVESQLLRTQIAALAQQWKQDKDALNKTINMLFGDIADFTEDSLGKDVVDQARKEILKRELEKSGVQLPPAKESFWERLKYLYPPYSVYRGAEHILGGRRMDEKEKRPEKTTTTKGAMKEEASKAPAKKSEQSGKKEQSKSEVRVRHPDGRTGTVPMEDLKRALIEGYEVLE